MAYSSQQLQNLRLAQTVGRKVGATATEQKAAIEAELVESGARNLNYGDRDSLGILQQRPSQGWSHARDPAGALVDFYAHARQYRGQGLSSGALAQSVQRSAFPGRYQQQAGAAQALLGTAAGPPAATGATGAGDPQARQRLLLTYLQDRSEPNALLTLAAGMRNLPAGASATPASPSGPGSTSPDTPYSAGRIASRAGAISSQHLPYQWGGGHGNTGPGQPLDCSGAVSKVLGINPLVAAQFASWGKPGEGSQVTIYAAKDGSHVLMKVNGHFFGTSRANPGGGAGWIPASAVPAGYLSNFVARHPAGD